MAIAVERMFGAPIELSGATSISAVCGFVLPVDTL